jgi:hypothetical protein
MMVGERGARFAARACIFFLAIASAPGYDDVEKGTALFLLIWIRQNGNRIRQKNFQDRQK